MVKKTQTKEQNNYPIRWKGKRPTKDEWILELYFIQFDKHSK